jgi:DNA-binding IclR family transcriptional regulator
MKWIRAEVARDLSAIAHCGAVRQHETYATVRRINSAAVIRMQGVTPAALYFVVPARRITRDTQEVLN